MAISFDINKMAMFRDVKLANENTIANLDGNGGVKAKGQYTGKFSAIGRSNIDQIANNKVRTALLKSLGQAFGLAGMNELDGGVVTFSKDFMDKLTKILGNDVLKRGDFKIGDDGVVKSGRPLTKRRIDAILTKATMVGKTDFDLGVYKMKLDTIKKELGIDGLNPKDLQAKLAKNNALKMFVIADKGLNMLQNQLFLAHQIDDPDNPGKKKTVYGPKNDIIDKSFMRVSRDYVEMKAMGLSVKDISMFQVREPDKGSYRDFSKPERDAMIMKMLPGQVFHLERSGAQWKTPADMEKEKRYIFSTVQLIVQKMVDLYFESKATGKLNLFMNHLASEPGACMEAKGEHLVNFEEKHFKNEEVSGENMSVAQIAELNRLADMVVGDPIDKQINAVVRELYETDDSFKVKDDWDKDFADIVKSKLVGKFAQDVKVEKDESRDQYKFTPITKSDGSPSMRKLSEADIDRIGRACLYNIVG